MQYPTMNLIYFNDSLLYTLLYDHLSEHVFHCQSYLLRLTCIYLLTSNSPVGGSMPGDCGCMQFLSPWSKDVSIVWWTCLILGRFFSLEDKLVSFYPIAQLLMVPQALQATHSARYGIQFFFNFAIFDIRRVNVHIFKCCKNTKFDFISLEKNEKNEWNFRFTSTTCILRNLRQIHFHSATKNHSYSASHSLNC